MDLYLYLTADGLLGHSGSIRRQSQTAQWAT